MRRCHGNLLVKGDLDLVAGQLSGGKGHGNIVVKGDPLLFLTRDLADGPVLDILVNGKPSPGYFDFCL